MDLTARLRRAAFARPHVLVVTAPGATEVRLAVERRAREAGWPLAESPADADALVMAGRPRFDLAEAADLVYAQMSAPTARVTVVDGDLSELAALPATLAERAVRQPEPAGPEPPEPPMADTAPDRDGLALDRLHVPLGPVLPDWPAGLRLRLALQGDVVQDAAVETVGGRRTPTEPVFWADPGRRVPSALDGLARLLAVAGWDAAAATARRLRDDALEGTVRPERLRRFARRVARSRALRAMTDGEGLLAGHDVTARWRGWLSVVTGADGGSVRRPAAEALSALPDLVLGRELAAVRLVVASLDPDLDEHPAELSEPVHG